MLAGGMPTRRVCGLAGGEQMARPCNHGGINHLAFDLKHGSAAAFGFGHYFFGKSQLVFRRPEGFFDGRHLFGVDTQCAAEAHIVPIAGGVLQAAGVVEIGVNGFDGRGQMVEVAVD